MTVFDHPSFDEHEHVVFHQDAASGLKAIIAIHNTARGTAVGGCRRWPNQNEADGLADALRLSRGLSYKSDLANLSYGSGESVIFGNPANDKSETPWHAMVRFVEPLGGRYTIAEDVGTSSADMEIVQRETAHVSGIAKGGSGDPSPATAWGVFVGIKAAALTQLGNDELKGLEVSVQGLGHVGFEHCRLLAPEEVVLYVADINRTQIDKAVKELGATSVSTEAVFGLDTDVFAPCTMGAILNDETIRHLKSTIIAGSADNQLAVARHGDALRKKGILYAPDYAINAGGIIKIANEGPAYNWQRAFAQVSRIYDTLREIFARAESEDVSTAVAANRIAQQRLRASFDEAA